MTYKILIKNETYADAMWLNCNLKNFDFKKTLICNKQLLFFRVIHICRPDLIHKSD